MTLVRFGDPLPPAVGPKAALLSRCAAAGLRVPAGAVWLDADGTEPTTAALGPLRPGERVALRSAFAAEDGAKQSAAGRYTSVLHVSTDDPAALTGALHAVWASGPGTRRDILVMRMVDAVHAGVAGLQEDFEDDLVEAVEGTAEGLVGGTATDVRRLLVPRLRHSWERAHRGSDHWRTPLPPWAMRLARLLRGVRRVVRAGDWDVEWADDGRVCWLLQVRRLSRPVRRDETYTLANHKEILPPLPSVLMAGLIAERGRELFAFYRRFDRALPADRSMIGVFEGRPYLDLSLLEDMLRMLGLPTPLLADSMGGHTAIPAGLRPLRLLTKAPALLRMARDQAAAPGRLPMIIAEMQRLQDRASRAGTATEVLAAAGDAYVHLVTGMMSLSTAIGPPLALLRKTGTLHQHAARSRSAGTVMWDDLDAVRRGAMTLDGWLTRHGHRGVYESDLAEPRFAERPPVSGTGSTARPVLPPRTVAGALTLPLWWQAGRAVQAREHWRDEAMRTFAVLRRRLIELAPVEPWLLTPDEVRALDRGWRPDDAFWAARHAERARHEQWDPPDLIGAREDTDRWRHGSSATGSSAPGRGSAAGRGSASHSGGARLRGLGLTSGTVTGQAWVLRTPSTELPDGWDRASTVLVARAVDAGWIPTFALVAAVVVETGGDLSHGSIILREIGLPAVTNVQGATRTIAPGTLVEVRARPGVVLVPSPHG